MIKNKIYENLDGYQLTILEKALEEKTIEEADVNEVYNNVQDQEYDAHLDWGGISEEAQENFGAVYRYLNSLKDDGSEPNEEDIEIRKKKAYEYVKQEYVNIQKSVDEAIANGDNAQDIVAWAYRYEAEFLKKAGVDNGLTDSEVIALCTNLDITFEGMNWEEIECVEE